MSDARAETLALLRSIDQSLRILAKREPAAASGPRLDLDGPYGNPTIKAKDPRDWGGDPMTGRKFSECPPEYLDLLADRYDYFATKAEEPQKQKYAELDAARARGWAARLRSGWATPAAAAQGEW